MSEWLQRRRRRPWAEHYFYKTAPSKHEAPNRDPGIVQSATEIEDTGEATAIGNPPTMTRHIVRMSDGSSQPRERVKITGNGHQGQNNPVGAPEGDTRQNRPVGGPEGATQQHRPVGRVSSNFISS
jgi:hypothetical protein